MNKTLKNVCIITRNIRKSAFSANGYQDIVPPTAVNTKIKTEEELNGIMGIKMKEYNTIIESESPEKAELTAEIAALDKRLRKSFGYGENEDLTKFPSIKFDDHEIDNQLN